MRFAPPIHFVVNARRSLASVLALVLASLPALAADPPVTDQSITDQVEDELLFDRAVSAARIDVKTNDGIVTLSGSVTNLLAKDRAARIAQAVKGVRAVVNQLDISPTKLRSDDALEEAVELALAEDAATEAFEVAVQAENGEVTLTGAVDSWQEKHLAGQVAKGVGGVMSLKNNLSVAYDDTRSDSEIEAEIEKALRWSVFVDHGLTEVDVENGQVQLSGAVGSATEKATARQLAWVAGVTDVDVRNLEVREWSRDPQMRKDKYVVKSASEIRQAINDVLLKDPRVAAFNVTPEVAGSLVTLRGTVDNLKAKRSAAQVARSTVGVSSVINRLKVRNGATADVSDEEMETSIRRALENDPYVERFEIVVDVVNGVAHLYGNVDTSFEKTRAEDKASRVYGVADVENHLDLDDYDLYSYDPYVDYDYYYDYDYDEPFDADTVIYDDSEIKEKINDELFWSPFVDADEVVVTVDDGAATLTGTVDSWSEKQAAEENAYEGGAVTVDNDLTIEYY